MTLDEVTFRADEVRLPHNLYLLLSVLVVLTINNGITYNPASMGMKNIYCIGNIFFALFNYSAL